MFAFFCRKYDRKLNNPVLDNVKAIVPLIIPVYSDCVPSNVLMYHWMHHCVQFSAACSVPLSRRRVVVFSNGDTWQLRRGDGRGHGSLSDSIDTNTNTYAYTKTSTNTNTNTLYTNTKQIQVQLQMQTQGQIQLQIQIQL